MNNKPYYLSDWSSTCTKFVFNSLKREHPQLMRELVKVLGEDRIVGEQFGNVTGWLKDFGHGELAMRLRVAIIDWNIDEWYRHNADAPEDDNPYLVRNLRLKYGPTHADWYERYGGREY